MDKDIIDTIKNNVIEREKAMGQYARHEIPIEEFIREAMDIAEERYLRMVTRELKQLWKEQGIHTNDVLREEVEDILLNR